MSDLPPNHHADYPQFAGPFGYLAGSTMVLGRGRDAGLVSGLADLRPGDRVLDIGCGPGTAVRHAAGTGIEVIGVDPAAPMLRLAKLLTRLRGPKGSIEWVQAGAEDMPIPDASVRVCWSVASVHHWPDLEAGLAEVRRVVEPGGLFIAVEKRTEPGAKGNASHGWTDQQARTFSQMLPEYGFGASAVDHHDVGRRKVVAVTARA